MRSPEVPKEVRDMHGSGRVILAGVVERDGRIGSVKVLIPSIYPAFDREASAAAEHGLFEGGGTLDGRPVRVFWLTEFTYQ
jgi:TonB family protein